MQTPNLLLTLKPSTPSSPFVLGRTLLTMDTDLGEAARYDTKLFRLRTTDIHQKHHGSNSNNGSHAAFKASLSISSPSRASR